MGALCDQPESYFKVPHCCREFIGNTAQCTNGRNAKAEAPHVGFEPLVPIIIPTQPQDIGCLQRLTMQRSLRCSPRFEHHSTYFPTCDLGRC